MELKPVIELAQALVRRPSVTPEDGGCLALLTDRLIASGFNVESVDRGGVGNRWATRGKVGPMLVLAGHVDVVPPGNHDDWQREPFSGDIADGQLHGRGSEDMKGGVAALVIAAERFVIAHPDHQGQLAFLITADEEGPAEHGTAAVVDQLIAQGISPRWCLLAEPTSVSRFGDTIKIGRRGSISAKVTLVGRQGHIAYPHLADNPLHRLGSVVDALVNAHWDDGCDGFQPTALQLSNVHGGTGTDNVIPGDVSVRFNLRYSPAIDAEAIQRQCRELLDRHAGDYRIEWRHSGLPFVAGDAEFVETMKSVVAEHTGIIPDATTGGGTSDGRFIAKTGAAVIEFGALGLTMHQANERTSIDDLQTLADVFETAIERLLVHSID
ncbi:succinyl-diaminopimelate desuccinylase [Gammaproteobacteria bacterium]|nr:succinyl-diaminopimelate desuccinylase [Gammaproteobacteria bacterium]